MWFSCFNSAAGVGVFTGWGLFCLCLVMCLEIPCFRSSPAIPDFLNRLSHCQVVLGDDRSKCNAVTGSETRFCFFQFNISTLNWLDYSWDIDRPFRSLIPRHSNRWTQSRMIECVLMLYALAKDVEPLPDKYSVTTLIRKSKLNLVIVKPLRLALVFNLRDPLSYRYWGGCF